MILIAGPCVIESRDFILQMAEELREIASLPNVDFYFKSSFDKANRTSISSFRGPGLENNAVFSTFEKARRKQKRHFDYFSATEVFNIHDSFSLSHCRCYKTLICNGMRRNWDLS